MLILIVIKPIFLIITIIMTLSFNSFAIDNMEGVWFECEFAGKTSKPQDNCKMLDNDGFIFSNNKATHISVIDSQEINCKKNKVGQCFKSDLDFVTARKGREDSVKFGNSKLILSFLGCSQVFHLKDISIYVEASPDEKKCFWAGKKIFYLKKFEGDLILKK